MLVSGSVTSTEILGRFDSFEANKNIWKHRETPYRTPEHSNHVPAVPGKQEDLEDVFFGGRTKIKKKSCFGEMFSTFDKLL